MSNLYLEYKDLLIECYKGNCNPILPQTPNAIISNHQIYNVISTQEASVDSENDLTKDSGVDFEYASLNSANVVSLFKFLRTF